MAKFSEVYGGSFLTAADIPSGREISVMIDRVMPEKLDDAMKLIVYFVGKTKGLVLNKTNGSVLANAYGDETDRWSGKTVVLFKSQAMFSGRLVDALRVRIADGQAPLNRNMPAPPAPDPRQYDAETAPVQPARYPGAEPTGDDIPF